MSSYILHKYSIPPVFSHPHTLAPPYQSKAPNALTHHPHILARLGFRQTIPLSTIHSHNKGSSIQWANITLTLWTLIIRMVSTFLVLNELASFPDMPCFMFYRVLYWMQTEEQKLARPRNEAMNKLSCFLFFYFWIENVGSWKWISSINKYIMIRCIETHTWLL